MVLLNYNLGIKKNPAVTQNTKRLHFDLEELQFHQRYVLQRTSTG